MTIHVHEHCLKMATRNDGTPWWTAFPEPQSQPDQVSADQVLALVEGEGPQPREYLLVDVRRTDCNGGTLTSSINLPAHSFYPVRKTLYNLCTRAGIKKVIFYCGQSNGRGPRCAAWMKDFVEEIGGDLQSLVLTGGIKGWIEAYGGRMVDVYDEAAWEAGKTGR